MQSKFDDKRKKYSYVLAKFPNIRYTILVVSPTHVFSNLQLAQEAVNELCMRMRMGLEVEAKITGILGNDIFRDEEVTLDEVKIEAILKGITYSPNDYIENYDQNIVDSSTGVLSNSEANEASRILQKCWDKTAIVQPQTRDKLSKYISKFTAANTTMKQKRIANFPFAFSTEEFNPRKFLRLSTNENAPSDIYKIWSQALDHFSNKQYSALAFATQDSQYQEAISNENIEGEQHKHNKDSRMKFDVSSEEREILATRGIEARQFDKKSKKVMEKESESKLSFHPSTNTKDISLFLKSNHLQGENESVPELSMLYRLLEEGKRYSMPIQDHKEDDADMTSLQVFKTISKTDFIRFANSISNCMSEISYDYKNKSRKSEMYVKPVIGSNCMMLVKSTGKHTFVSYCFPKDNLKIIDTGRLGPSLFDTEEHIITDFCSYDEAALEHLVKSGPYFVTILTHLLSHYNVALQSITSDNLGKTHSKSHVLTNFWETARLILLLYLNNKFDAEEMITSQRYLYMKIMEMFNPDIYGFVDRFPDVLRSRLSVFILNRLIEHLDYYSEIKVQQSSEILSDNSTHHRFNNLKSLFFDGFVSIEQKINEFYFGYVVSKIKGRSSDSSFKIMRKILKEEYQFRDEVDNVFYYGDKPKKHCVNKSFFKYLISRFQFICSKRYGQNYKLVFKQDILRNFAYSSFSTLATLKASAKMHKGKINIDKDVIQGSAKDCLLETKKRISAMLQSLNPEEYKSRPKVIESISRFVKEYIELMGRTPTHLFDLVPFALKRLEEKGGFNSDVFPKSQHGGDREIHVLEIAARIIQYFLENISRTLCSKFQSEACTHPDEDDNFIEDHYRKSSANFEKYSTICKSADISKWCQRNHVSKFCSLMMSLTDSLFHGFIFRGLKLWVAKRITFPIELAATLMANEKTILGDDLQNRFRQEFYRGTGVVNGPMNNTITIKSGMMQGILHFTSSLMHTCLHEVMRDISLSVINGTLGLECVYSIVQGSDDSAAGISIPSKKLSDILFCRRILMWKEEASEYVSMFPSREKTSCGTLDMVEFHSEWHLRRKVVKPTFRWVNTCLETALVERFAERMRMFYNMLSQALEGGASTFECSIFQMCQAWMHYKLLGLGNNPLFLSFQQKIISAPFPSIGFYPLDMDVLAGIGGFDFQLYCLAKFSNFGKYAKSFEFNDLDNIIDYTGKRSTGISQNLKSVRIGFGKLTLWKTLLSRVDLGELSEVIEKVDENPMLVFGRHTTWEEDKVSILLKLFSPGVKSSLSNFQPAIRMMVASAYLLNRPCFTQISELELVESQTFSEVILDAVKSMQRISDLPMSLEDVLKLGLADRLISEIDNCRITCTSQELIQILDVTTTDSKVSLQFSDLILAKVRKDKKRVKTLRNLEPLCYILYTDGKILSEIDSSESMGNQMDNLKAIGISKHGENKKRRKSGGEAKEKKTGFKMDTSKEKHVRHDQPWKSRYSLLSLIEHVNKMDVDLNEEDMKSLFPYYPEYDNLLEIGAHLQQNKILVGTDLSRSSKISIEVIKPTFTDEFPLIDMVKAKWWGLRTVPIGRSQIEVFWQATREKYKFLEDTYEETSRKTGLSAVELADKIKSISSKVREIRLSDSQAKNNSLRSVITRIYWPCVKLRSKKPLENFHDAVTLRANLFSIVSFPFVNTYKVELCSKIIKANKHLTLPYSEIDQSAKKLKVFHDFLCGTEKSLILHMITKKRLGTMGYFSKRQKFQRSDGRYKGEGEWRGLIMGVSCILEFRDDECVCITLNRVVDMNLLGQSLLTLIHTHKSKFPTNPDTSPNRTYLSTRGRFFSTPNDLHAGFIPVILDSDLIVDIYEDMLQKAWKISCSNMTIRLTMKDENLNPYDPYFTILSDTFRVADWDSSSDFLLRSEPLLKEWHSNEPTDSKEFNSIFFPILPSDEVNYRKWLNVKNKTGFTSGRYDLQQLSNNLALSVLRSGGEKESIIEQLRLAKNLRLEPLDITDEELEEFLKKVEFGSISGALDISATTGKSWADMVLEAEDQSDDDDSFFNEASNMIIGERELDRLCSELFDMNTTSEELEELGTILQKGMPTQNKFFNSLTIPLQGILGFDIQQAYQKSSDVSLPGVVGKLLSVWKMRFSYEAPTDNEDLDLAVNNFELEEGTIKSIGSSQLNGGSTQQTIEDLRTALNQMDIAISNSTGLLLKSLTQMRSRTERRLMILEGNSQTQTLEDVDYENFMMPLIERMIDMGKLSDFRSHALDETYVIPLFMMELNAHLTSQLERKLLKLEDSSSYRLALRRREISPWLLDIICSKFELSLEIVDGGDKIYLAGSNGISHTTAVFDINRQDYLMIS